MASLETLAETFIIEQLNETNAVEVWKFAGLYNRTKMKEAAVKYAKENASKMCGNVEKVKKMPRDLVNEVTAHLASLTLPRYHSSSSSYAPFAFSYQSPFFCCMCGHEWEYQLIDDGRYFCEPCFHARLH